MEIFAGICEASEARSHDVFAPLTNDAATKWVGWLLRNCEAARKGDRVSSHPETRQNDKGVEDVIHEGMLLLPWNRAEYCWVWTGAKQFVLQGAILISTSRRKID